jgi:hypothetical protein
LLVQTLESNTHRYRRIVDLGEGEAVVDRKARTEKLGKLSFRYLLTSVLRLKKECSHRIQPKTLIHKEFREDRRFLAR